MTVAVTIQRNEVAVTPTATGVDMTVAPVQTSVVISGGVGPQGPQGNPGPSLTVKEIDGAPSIANVLELRVSNGTLADLGGGVASLTTGGGGGGSASALDDLTDVTLTSPANNQLLAYNGSVWVNAANAPAWANVTGTPTTLSGYGITDAASDSELAAHEADTTNIHGIANTANLVLTSDSRLSDSRIPTLHASTHATGGTDPVSPASIGAATAVALSTHIGDTNNPHAVTLAQVGGAPVGAKYLVQTADSTLTNEQALGALATGLLKNTTATGVLSTAIGDTDYTLPVTFNAHVGNTTGVHGIADTSQLVLTSDSRLSDSRTPTAHHASHQHGGSDEVATATPGANVIPKAGSGSTLALGFIPSLPASQITSGEIPRSPLTTRGDLLTRDATAHKRLALGAAGTFLNSDGTDALWRALLAADIPGLDTSKLTTGQLALARGGTGADLSATGGANQVVKQTSSGGAFTVGALVAADIPSLDASKLTTGTLSPARGGTGVDNGTNALTIPATGTATLGTGTTGRMTEWGGTNTLQASSLIKSGSNLLTLNVDANQTWSALGNTLVLGLSAGAANSAANSWVALGSNAAPANTDGTDWIAIGAYAAYRNVHGNSWTAIGGGAANNNTGSGFFTAVGSLAGYSNTSGNSWTAIGTSAGQSNTNGSGWVAIGVNAATSSDTGKEFAAVGTRAGQSNIDGWWWTAIGTEAGSSSQHGDYWIAIGRQAGYSNVSGSRNIFIGHQAGYAETGSDKLYIEPTSSARPLLLGDFSTDQLTLHADWSATTTLTTHLTLDGNSTSTPAAGFGSRLLWNLGSSTTASRNAADWSASWATATDASRKARMVGTVYDTAAREWIRGEADGSNPLIGFLGASAVIRQTITGDRQGNAALASLLTGLANEGLVTDSTASATPTYTPTYVGGTSAGSTTYTSQTGVYRQVGDMVFFSAKVVWTAASGTGNARVSLPSTAANVSNQDFAVSVYHTLVTFTNGSVVGRIQPNTNYVEFLSPATNAAGTAIAVEAAGTIVVSGLYLV